MFWLCLRDGKCKETVVNRKMCYGFLKLVDVVEGRMMSGVFVLSNAQFQELIAYS